MEPKIDRSAFLYMEPDDESFGKNKKFAQCGTCKLWTGAKRKRCFILGKDKLILSIDTCALYVNGEPDTSLAGKEEARLTLEEAGYERRSVRCENCIAFNRKESICELFRSLNKKMPDMFDLNENVLWDGCCNANTPLPPSYIITGTHKI